MGAASSEPRPGEERMPWALSQAAGFDADECPFCALRRSHLSWLQTEKRRIASEAVSLHHTIPQRLHGLLQEWLQGGSLCLPESCYTGGVDEVKGSACPRCSDRRKEVRQTLKEARALDAQCKALIEFHRRFARKIEAMLIEKRRVEAGLFFGVHSSESGEVPDGNFCAITKVNEGDDIEALLQARELLLGTGQLTFVLPQKGGAAHEPTDTISTRCGSTTNRTI